MNHSREPVQTIELDLHKIAKQMFQWTGLSFAVLFLIHFLVNRPFDYSLSFFFIGKNMLLFIIGYIVLIVLHEFFHLLGFHLFSGVPWKSMKVGVNLKLGVAYATTNHFMTNRSIRKSLLLPFWLTGLLPTLIGLYADSSLLIILSTLLIGGAAGDFAMYKQLKKFPDDWLVQDHPTEPKLYLFTPDE